VIGWRWLGRVPFPVANQAQRDRRAAILAGRAASEIWLLEHEPVYTTGLRGDPALDGRELPAPRFAIDRGGLTTWHGPGQLVAWPVVDVAGRGGSVKGTVHAMESAVIATLGALGVSAHTRPGLPGVWTTAGKIGAVGVHFRRGVVNHGLALNLDPDLSWFDAITPCGLPDPVTSVARILGEAPTPAALAPALGRALSAALG
jgi:lipoyl(octanoyl) transferase